MFNFCLISGPHSKRALRWISLTCLCVCMLPNRIADIYAPSRSLLLTCTLVLFLTCVFFLARQTPHLQVTNSETIRQSIIPARRKGRNSDPCSFPCRTPTTSIVKHNDATKPQEGNQFFFNTSSSSQHASTSSPCRTCQQLICIHLDFSHTMHGGTRSQGGNHAILLQ